MIQNIAVIGAGKIGSIIAKYLAETGDYYVTVADSRPVSDTYITNTNRERIRSVQLDAREGLNLSAEFAVINAGPHHLTRSIVSAALRDGCHYLDLTEDVGDAAHIKLYAEGAKKAFIPQCGLAPGFVSIMAAHLAKGFNIIDTIKLRVGALPNTNTNAPLGYALTWSTDGLINEYCNPCDEISNGVTCLGAGLGGLEELHVFGNQYEAFNTSGGVGTLCETFAGRVRYLNYKTIRYPGHAAAMRLLINDFRLREDRATLRHILERAIPTTDQDKVVICISVSGYKDGRYTQDAYANVIYGNDKLSAIQVTTASAACAVLDLLAKGKLPQSGLIKQEDIPFSAFSENRFGGVYGKA
jgi:saccharopine dehydrogenase-like NADP-dependent oxidoreductase